MPLTSLQAAIASLVTATIALVVGLGIMSPHSGGEVVAFAGIAIGSVFAIANAIIHHGVTLAASRSGLIPPKA